MSETGLSRSASETGLQDGDGQYYSQRETDDMVRAACTMLLFACAMLDRRHEYFHGSTLCVIDLRQSSTWLPPVELLLRPNAADLDVPSAGQESLSVLTEASTQVGTQSVGDADERGSMASLATGLQSIGSGPPRTVSTSRVGAFSFYLSCAPGVRIAVLAPILIGCKSDAICTFPP